MSERDEDMVRRALKDEALGFDPPEWPGGVEALQGRIARRRQGLRNGLVVALAATATVAAAVVGVAATAHSSGSAEAVPPAPAMAGGAASPGAHPPARTSASVPATQASTPTPAPWPAVLVVPAGRDLDFAHQIWLKLSPGERCMGVGPAAQRAYSCKSVTDGNQAQNSVGLQVTGGSSGSLYSPLYIGPGDVARMTVEVGGTVYRATVVKLAGHPGYATAYVWVTGRASTPAMGQFDAVKIMVYDAQGKLLASTP